MKIEKVKIKNFKGLKEAEIKLTSFGCLVGENNAGKSTVLQALVSALDRPNQLPLSLYYDAEKPVVVTLEFSEIADRDMLRLSEDHRGRMSDVVVDERFTLIVTWPPENKCELTTPRRMPKEPRYKSDHIAETLKGKTGGAVRQTLIEEYPEFADGAPDPLNITAAKAYLAEKIQALELDSFELVPSPLPTGIPTSITRLLPEPIYVPAVKNLSDELKTTQSTSFGRLLGLLLEDLEPELETIHKSFEDLDALLNRVSVEGQLTDKRHEKVKELEGMVERFLGENFPSAKVELNVPKPELKTILNAAQIYVDDGSRDLIDNKGDGIKRSLTFALLQTYVSRLGAVAEVENAESPLPRPLIFLFEEPELYLHPKSQRVLFQTLARISAKYQVLVTTHSPLFFAPGITATFVRVAKEPAEPKPVGVLYPVEFDLDPDSAEAFRLARFENADAAFFSRRVVLFEGESDDAYCRHVAALLNNNWDFDRENISLVRVSGKGNFAKFRRFFEAFGIEVKIVADLDALFEGYEHLGAPGILHAVRDDAIQKVDGRIAELEHQADPSANKIRDKVRNLTMRERYAAAREAARKTMETRELAKELVQCLEDLFEWENIDARTKVCSQDNAAREAIIPLLDGLRAAGICVLSRGAIEAYYPNDVPTSGPKPTRALKACNLVATSAAAAELSAPLTDGRDSELNEIFAEIFS